MDDNEPTLNLRLIEAVKHSPCLYDQNDRQYRSAEFKMKIWARLATVLQFHGDKNMLAARWKQLRDKYGKEKKKSKEVGETPTWQYFKHLSFLDPHMSDRGGGSRPSNKEIKLPSVSDVTFATTLIEEVKHQPCLYDPRDPKYRHTECRNIAWQFVIRSMQYPGDTVQIAKQWKTLRDHYVRERRLLTEGVREESTWELFQAMSWMADYLAEKEKRDTQNSFGLRHKRIRRSDSPIDDSDGAVLEEEDMYDETLGGFIHPRKMPRPVSSDVLLDGDSAFAASVVSDLRTLQDASREYARHQIENLLQRIHHGHL